LIPDNIKILETLEKDYNAISIFKYKSSTAWVNIKNFIYSKSFQIEFSQNYDLHYKKFFFFFFLSLKNLFSSFGKSTLFVGAGSGIVEHEGNLVDVYFPHSLLDEKNVFYFTSADILDKMYENKTFYKENKVIVHSFLFSSFRNLFAKILKGFVSTQDKDIIDYLNKKNITITHDDLNYIYAKFVAAYWIYKIVFYFKYIEKAYVISSYSNSEIIAVLKEKGVEVIELQHGILGELHRGYNYKIKSPILPTPNKVMVYNDFWKEELLEAQYYTSHQIEILPRFQYDAVQDKQLFDKKYIVFTGQGICKIEIERFLLDAIEFLEKNDIYLIYLPHPSEKGMIEIDNPYIKIIERKEDLTEQYIYSAIAHISIYSSCHFDAVHFQNKTYILDCLEGNIMNYYRKNNSEKFIYIKDIIEMNYEN